MRCLLFILLIPTVAFASHPECLLDSLPKTKNDVVAKQVSAECLRKFPDGFSEATKHSKPGLFPFNSGADCTKKKASDTTSPLASRLIQGACYHLYEPKFDPSTAKPVN